MKTTSLNSRYYVGDVFAFTVVTSQFVGEYDPVFQINEHQVKQ